MKITINGFELIQTCDACPEQYDVFKDGSKIAYLRLRHGIFRCHYLDPSGEEIYCAEPSGDGMFEYDERVFYLTEAIHAVSNYIKN